MPSMQPAPPLLPGSRRPDGRITTLGVLGGGQLGRMFVHAAQAMGFRTLVLDPDVVSPAGAAADVHLRAAFDDAQALQAMARQCDAVTTEFENVPAEVLQRLAGAVRVAPSAEAVAVCQHRAREKACFLSSGVPCVPHARIETETEAATPDPALFPGVLKTSSLGYDGKGQVRVGAPADLPAAWHALGRRPCVLERRIDLAAEVSVVIARGRDGTVVTLPVHWNLHRDGILAVTVVPASAMATAGPTALDWQDLQGRARGHARTLVEALDYAGVLCVEFFVQPDGTLLANEMAPRPHNSGHPSLDACDLSQFELQVRALAGLPLPMPRLHSTAVMLNLLGDLWFDGGGARDAGLARGAGVAGLAQDPRPADPPWDRVLALPGVHLHLYGKAEPRRGRKMGHLTITAADAQAAWAVAAQAALRLGLPPPPAR